MFENSEMMQRVIRTNEVYMWGFLVICFVGLILVLGQDIMRLYRKYYEKKSSVRQSKNRPSKGSSS